MIRIATTIYDNYVRKIVPSELIIGVDTAVVEKTGSQWKSERLQFACSGSNLEHWHWDWGKKHQNLRACWPTNFLHWNVRKKFKG